MFVPQEKVNYGFFFLLNLLSKFIDMYRMDAVLSLILLVSDVLKIPKIKVEAHFLKKLNFVTNKCLTRDAFEKCPRITENLSKSTALQLSQYIVIYTNFLFIAYTLDFFYKQLRILSRTQAA